MPFLVLIGQVVRPDFNLLLTLDVLLTEESVARSARKLQLSPSAMSRALARLRDTMGDPLLVRAGRRLVPTPRAAQLREQVRRLVDESEAILRPAKLLDLRSLTRTFTLRTSDGFVETFGPSLLKRIERDAPAVRLRLLRKLDKDSASLRDGTVDLETGVIGKDAGPELRTQPLFRDRLIGVVRAGHALAEAPVTASAYAAERHVVVSRRRRDGPVEDALKGLGLKRSVAASVDGFSAALALARDAGLVATVPALHTQGLRAGLETFPLPFEVPEVMISSTWHPRQDADPAHRWLRQCVRESCAQVFSPEAA